MYMPKAEGKEGDWFAELDEELEKKMLQITDTMQEQSSQKVAVTKSLLEDFYRVQMRFNKINVHFTLSPESTAFLKFSDPEHWALKQDLDFDFGRIDSVSLGDRTQGRVGDALKAWYYSVDNQVHLRVVFEYCEGEHYYKYAGWKRIFSQYVLIDVPVTKFEEKKYHEVLADVVKAWYESHLRRDREIVLKHLRDKYEKGETFTQ